MKIKKGDTILIISGKDRGKTGKVMRSFPQERRILVEGANLRNKHIKAKSQGEKGQMVKVSSPMQISNVKFLCPQCKKATRVGYKVMENKKHRICKKCKAVI